MGVLLSEAELCAYCDSVEDLFKQTSHSVKVMCAMVEKNPSAYSNELKSRCFCSMLSVDRLCSLLPHVMYWKENGECMLTLGSAVKYMDLATSWENLGVECLNPYFCS